MYILLGVLFIMLGTIMIWFHIPYSPIKHEFNKDVHILIEKNSSKNSNEVFTKNDFSNLPIAIQKYIEKSGYLGTQKMSYLKMEYYDVNFMQGKDSPPLKIDYTQYNFVNEPNRLALIDSSMFGVPFEGYDYYKNGKGGMKGVIAKAITLFHQKGTNLDKASLVTFLAESLFAPTILTQNYIEFEQLTDFKVKAKIIYDGQTASGIFTFNKDYELTSFTTNDRAVVGTDGTINYVPWTAICSQYKIAKNGINYPTKFQAVWNYPESNFVYFDGIISKISYDFEPLNGC